MHQTDTLAAQPVTITGLKLHVHMCNLADHKGKRPKHVRLKYGNRILKNQKRTPYPSSWKYCEKSSKILKADKIAL